MSKIYVEENGSYSIDCSKAAWSTNEIHAAYHRAGLDLSDVDFAIESRDGLLLLIEYKMPMFQMLPIRKAFARRARRHLGKCQGNIMIHFISFY